MLFLTLHRNASLRGIPSQYQMVVLAWNLTWLIIMLIWISSHKILPWTIEAAEFHFDLTSYKKSETDQSTFRVRYEIKEHFLAHLSTTCSRGAFRVTGCPSCVVRREQFFKHQLLLNRWANLDQTWQECSLGGPL